MGNILLRKFCPAIKLLTTLTELGITPWI